MARALRAGHRILLDHSLNPTHGAFDIEAKALETYQAKLAGLALLAPSLQRMILEGRPPRGVTLQSILHDKAPLAWADQEAWLEGLALPIASPIPA